MVFSRLWPSKVQLGLRRHAAPAAVVCALSCAFTLAVEAAESAETEVPADEDKAKKASSAAARLLAEYWLPRDQMVGAQRAQLPEWCDGGYRILPQPFAADVDVATLPIQAEAGSVRYFIDERLELSGGVEIKRGNRTVRTESAILYQETEKAELSGRVALEEPGLVVIGDGAQVDLSNDSAALDDVSFLLTQAGLRGQAERVAQSEDGDLQITRGSVTRCDPGSNTWRLDGRSDSGR